MLPFVTIRKPLPYDTTLLNYNWQIWGCKAFSLYAGQTNYVEDSTSMQSVEAGARHPLPYYKGRGELKEEKMMNQGDSLLSNQKGEGMLRDRLLR